MRKIAICLLVIGFAVTAAAGCGKGPLKGKAAEDAVPVKVMAVESMDLNRTLEYVGNIKGQDEAIVYPKVSGKIIEKVKDEGASVARGDVIAYIDRDEVGLQFEKAPIESPLAGDVGRVYIDIGSNVTTQTPIALISNMDKTEISLDVPEKYLPTISIGQDAVITVDAYPGEKFIGKVDMISPMVDLQTRAAPIEIVIDNPGHKLQSGMFARISLIIEGYKGVPVILKEAVMGRSPNHYVYVIEGGRAVMKKVILGIRQGSYYQVIDGVTKGDKVVIMGQQRLRDGASAAAEE